MQEARDRTCKAHINMIMVPELPALLKHDQNRFCGRHHLDWPTTPVPEQGRPLVIRGISFLLRCRILGNDRPVAGPEPFSYPAVHFSGDGGYNRECSATLLNGIDEQLRIFSRHIQLPGGLAIVTAAETAETVGQGLRGVPDIKKSADVLRGDVQCLTEG